MTIPARTPVVHMILPVADMASTTSFYRDLGFEVRAYDEGYAWVHHGRREVFHLNAVADLDPNANPTTGYLHVRDCDEWHGAWAERADSEPVDQPWGMREFTITDPSGNTLRVGHNL